MQKCNFQVRKALLSDDPCLISRYLHLTDPYIYPKICQDPTDEAWVALISSCIKAENNIFSIGHLSVALHDGIIIGVMCVIPCGRKLDFPGEGRPESKEFADRLAPVMDGYFHPLISESLSSSGFNVTNVCVDRAYCRKGVGALLMSHCMKEYGHETIHLDVIASNKTAVGLYKRHGFEITNEYLGYSGDDTELPCYHMLYTPKTK